MYTPEQRIEKYKQQPETIQRLYSSETSTELNKTIKQKFRLDDHQYSAFLDVIGDTILGFYHTKDLPQLLQTEAGLSADEAQRVVRDLAEFLSPILEREASEEQAEQTSAGYQPPAPKVEIQTRATNTEPEEDIHEVVPMRTMKGDIERIHGYGAYRDQFPADAQAEEVPTIKSEQDAVLKKQPLVETPKMTE